MADATLMRFDGPVADLPASDLRGAITAATRGEALTDRRRELVARSLALGKRGWIPDNWRDDGTLRSATAMWSTDEQRETYSDLVNGLEAALDEVFADEDSWYYIWIQDLTTTEVIYSKGGDLFSAPYTVAEGGQITIGEPAKVRPVSEYVPLDVVQTGQAPRSAGPLVEWRRQKVAGLKGLERRTFDVQDMELREANDGSWRLTGYACVTGVPYDVGWYEETIQRGAFKRTLSESPDVQLLINHAGMPLARTSSGTLRLEERSTPDASGKTGLWVDAGLDPLDPDAQSLKRKMDRRDIDQMSFAFQPTASDWSDDYSQRSVVACSIHRGDVSVVNQGANQATYASIRSQDALAALHRTGPDALVGALVEWRDRTLEMRAGATLSAATMEVLTNVLNLVASADEAVDEAQPMLATLMGVANPDEPEPDAPEADDVVLQQNAVVLPDFTTRARERLAMLQRGR